MLGSLKMLPKRLHLVASSVRWYGSLVVSPHSLFHVGKGLPPCDGVLWVPRFFAGQWPVGGPAQGGGGGCSRERSGCSSLKPLAPFLKATGSGGGEVCWGEPLNLEEVKFGRRACCCEGGLGGDMAWGLASAKCLCFRAAVVEVTFALLHSQLRACGRYTFSLGCCLRIAQSRHEGAERLCSVDSALWQ